MDDVEDEDPTDDDVEQDLSHWTVFVVAGKAKMGLLDILINSKK